MIYPGVRGKSPTTLLVFLGVVALGLLVAVTAVHTGIFSTPAVDNSTPTSTRVS